jgi:glycosyltransferase involved in cell wall biosynthesis
MDSYSVVSRKINGERIRIVHVITGLNVGGAEKMLCKLLSHVDQSRFDMRVLSLLGGGKIGQDIMAIGIPVDTLNLHSPLSFFQSLSCLRQYLLKTRPDILQGWMYHGNLVAWCARFMLKRRIPLVWGIRHSLHDISRQKCSTTAVILFCAAISRAPERILYNSMQSRLHHEHLGFHYARGDTIPNGFEVDIYRPNSESRLELRRELGISKETPLVGLVARFDPLKDHQNFLAAIALVSQKHSAAHFVLIGLGMESSNPHLLRDKLSPDLQKKLHFLGERHDIPSITASLDIAVSSSISEGFSNSIGEAMSCGVPCVVTDVGDSAHILGVCGQVVPPSDSAALAHMIISILELPTQERLQLGKMARMRIIENFSIGTVVTRYHDLYEELLVSKGN